MVKRMMKAVGVALMVGWLLPVSAMAAGATGLKVAIFDPQVALWSSEPAQGALKIFKADIKPQEDSMASIKKQLDALGEKMRKDASVMSETDKKKIQTQGDDLYRQYQSLAMTVQEKSKKMQQQVISALTPRLEKAIGKIEKDESYDLVLDAHSAIIYHPELDITKKVIEGINKQSTAPAPAAGK